MRQKTNKNDYIWSLRIIRHFFNSQKIVLFSIIFNIGSFLFICNIIAILPGTIYNKIKNILLEWSQCLCKNILLSLILSAENIYKWLISDTSDSMLGRFLWIVLLDLNSLTLGTTVNWWDLRRSILFIKLIIFTFNVLSLLWVTVDLSRCSSVSTAMKVL